MSAKACEYVCRYVMETLHDKTLKNVDSRSKQNIRTANKPFEFLYCISKQNILRYQQLGQMKYWCPPNKKIIQKIITIITIIWQYRYWNTPQDSQSLNIFFKKWTNISLAVIWTIVLTSLIRWQNYFMCLHWCIRRSTLF